MPRFFSIFLLTIAFYSHLQAQSNLINETKRIWNADSGRWDLWQVESWEYDQKGRETSYFVTSDYTDDANPKNSLWIQQKYDQDGNLVLWRREVIDDGYLQIFQFEHRYNGQGKLIESTQRYQANGNTSLSNFKKIYYTYASDGRKITVDRHFWFSSIDNYSLYSSTDTIFDGNGCMIEVYDQYFPFNDPSPNRIERELMARDSECRLLTQETQAMDFSTSSYLPLNRETHEYLNGGKTKNTTREKYYQSISSWGLTSKNSTEYDDKFRVIKNRFGSGAWSDSLSRFLTQIFTETKYDEQDRFLHRHTYRNDTLDRLDTVSYTFNMEGQVIKKKEMYLGYLTPFSIIRTFNYSYYCDGLVKQEMQDALPAVYRTNYLYDFQDDCVFDTLTLAIFPNPSNGIFEIESNLLSSTDAVIRVFSSSGQEVYSRINSITIERERVDVSELNPGSYYVFVQNGKRSASKKILISD